MIRLSATICVAALSISSTIAGTAAAQPVAESPVFRIGDYWQFSQTKSDAPPGRWSRTIIETAPEGVLTVRFGGGGIGYYEKFMNYVGSIPDEGSPRELARYPMRVGDKWSYSRRFKSPNSEERGTVKVLAFENVSVPAGTFDCYRVESDATFSTTGASTETISVRWYCPAIKWIAKEHVKSRTTSKYGLGSASEQASELIRYKLAP